MPLFISLTAGLVASIILIIRRKASLMSIITILAVLLVFYIVGLIFRSVLVALKTSDKKTPAGGDDGETDDKSSQKESGDAGEQQGQE